MEFIKYQHVERLGSDEVDGILYGTCYVFPKIDGTNGSIWLNNDGTIGCGSRNRVLSIDNDNAGFCKWVLSQQKFKDFFSMFPNVILYGEWLVPHTLKTYRDDAWRNFYVFDVVDFKDGGITYIPYPTYKVTCEKFRIDFIPPLCMIDNPTEERITSFIVENKFLIKDGSGIGEGIVVKNYNFTNKYGRKTWAKIVTNEFKDKHISNSECRILKEKDCIEIAIVDKYITKTLVDKEYAKLAIDGWNSKMIPRLLMTVFYCLVQEHTWDFVKGEGFPVIDFSRLKSLTINKIKQLKPALF